MDELEGRLAEYYDREGRSREATPLGRSRIDVRRAFVDLLHGERRQRLIDVGSGPGRDAVYFAANGFPTTAVDRSIGHARLAAAAGLVSVQATLLALPFPPDTFDAGWTMSTLVHLPDERWDAALTSITTVLSRPHHWRSDCGVAWTRSAGIHPAMACPAGSSASVPTTGSS